jgi:hypothetical protein
LYSINIYSNLKGIGDIYFFSGMPAGYVSALEAQGRAPGKAPFEQLVSGVVWLVKDGVNYVQQDLPYEDPTTQTTGTIQVS